MSRPCIFYDRDGVVNTAPDAEEYYILKPERLFIESGWLDALQVTNQLGYDAVIVTNQKCVFKGLLSPDQLAAIHQKIWDAVTERGLSLTAIYSATQGDDAPDAKPKPGMLLRAANEHDLDLSRSWMIGDSVRDIEAGQRAGCAATVLIGKQSTSAHHHVSRIDELPALLQNALGTSP